MFMINTISFKSPFGWITICEKDNKVLSLKFLKSTNKGKSYYLNDVKKQILDFCKKKIIKLNINILLNVTILEKKIFKEIIKIKYGKTLAYSDIAKKLKTSPRYVGNVCAKNDHLLIIPCHRVIRLDGTLGGFSAPSGIELKKKLIDLEYNE